MKWPEPRPRLAACLLTIVTLACLLPFLGKAFHIDDPLFIWTAKHLQTHPLDFYGFTVNWGFHEKAMSDEMQNPPLAAYYLAAVGGTFGWSEYALHFGFLLPAAALILGTYCLARRFCSHPFAAALAVLAMPVFLLSSTGLMCDTMMVALWIWAVFFWIDGFNPERPLRLWLAAFLIAICALTKYFGTCLIPLLIVYSVLERPRTWGWLKYFLVPILVLGCYEWLTARRYRHGLLSNAVTYVTTERIGGGWGSRLLETSAFCGGCTIVALIALPLLWGRKGLIAAAIGIITTALLMLLMKNVGVGSFFHTGNVNWIFLFQMALFIIGGIIVFALAVSDAIRDRTPASMLLALWVGGCLAFVGVVNWTVSGRNFLPLAPAVALLVVRRLEFRLAAGRSDPFRYWWCPLGISLAIALLVARADWQFANSARTAAATLNRQLAARSNGVAFEGHWGFHYYMEQLGAKPLAQKPLLLNSNEAVVIPMGNTCIFDLPSNLVEPLADVEVTGSQWLAIQNTPAGAGYYSDDWGPAPFVFGRVSPESYWVFRAK